MNTYEVVFKLQYTGKDLPVCTLTVEAESYELQDGFFWFGDWRAIAADAVLTIGKVEDQAKQDENVDPPKPEKSNLSLVEQAWDFIEKGDLIKAMKTFQDIKTFRDL